MIERYGGPRAEAQFLDGVAAGDFEPVELAIDDYARMAELVTQYGDLPLGTTDASVIALAERLNAAAGPTQARITSPLPVATQGSG